MSPDTSKDQDGIGPLPRGLAGVPREHALAFVGLLRAGEHLDRVLDAELEAAHGISLREWEVLLFLAVYSGDGRLRLSDLTARAPLSQSRVSRLVADLERKGLVLRSPDTDDARGRIVSITRKGATKFRASRKTHLEGLERHLFARITPEQVQSLAEITTLILGKEVL